MKLDFGLQLSQKQGLTLTAQVQQAIKLLQMTNLEICTFVEEQFQDNPFIEENSYAEQNAIQTDRDQSNKDLASSLEEAPYKQASDDNKVSQDNQFETGESYTPQSTVAKESKDFDAINLIADTKKSLYAHCEEFSKTLALSPLERLIASQLIEELEPTGWMSTPLSSIAHMIGTDQETVENVLLLLQGIEPVGIFARNLKECLTLQALDQNLYCGTMEVLLDNLHLVGAGKFDLLKRRCGCNDDEIAKLFVKIKSLNPKPGTLFESIDIPIREPDLRVIESNDGWVVELNNSTLPNVIISKEYAQDLNKKVAKPEEREFIRGKISEAKWLANAIQKRNDTMIKVGSEIIKRQTEFLEKGAAFIKPMILNDIAEAVGMHESTISRVTTGSLVQTPRGTLELKAFFSVGVQQEGDSAVASAASIKYRIKKMIENENPSAPISDDLIVEKLAEDGISVARRTVAKYRKLDNIPSSFSRKRRNIIAGLSA